MLWHCSVVLLLYFSISLSFKATFVTEIDTEAIKKNKKKIQEKDTFKTTWHLHNQNSITHPHNNHSSKYMDEQVIFKVRSKDTTAPPPTPPQRQDLNVILSYVLVDEMFFVGCTCLL